jgi:hypothetical protein
VGVGTHAAEVHPEDGSRGCRQPFVIEFVNLVGVEIGVVIVHPSR